MLINYFRQIGYQQLPKETEIKNVFPELKIKPLGMELIHSSKLWQVRLKDGQEKL